jgi:murein DD-endopeptidase MepM/ murein hydrolase activator NlpD
VKEDLPQWRDELLYEEYSQQKAGFAAGKARAILVASALGIVGVALVLFAVLAGGGGSETPAARGGDAASGDGGGNGIAPAGATSDDAGTNGRTEPETTPTPARDLAEGAEALPAAVTPELDRERFILPLRAWTSLGDRFGADRVGDKVHTGLDFILTKHPRSDIYAACSGSVTGMQSSPQLGRFLVIDCGAGWTAVYGFIGEPRVKVRDVVERGVTVIAQSDPADSPFGEHLHFEIRWRGVPVDPEGLVDLTGASYTPTPTATPEPSPSPSPSPSATPTTGTQPSPGGTTNPDGGTNPTTDPGTPGSTATPPSPPPTATPTNTPEPTPTPTNTPVPTPTPTKAPPPPTPTPTPRPQL